MKVIIPMSGQGKRFQRAGYKEPKPLVQVSGVPMISRLLKAFPPHWEMHFIMADNHLSSNLTNLLRQLRPNAKIESIPQHSLGPSAPLERALQSSDLNQPVLVSYCDFGMDWNPAEFEAFVKGDGCDACVITYSGFHPHLLRSMIFAYCRMDSHDFVREVREKGFFTETPWREPISAGAYYFASGKILQDALSYQKAKNLSLNGEYYTSLTVEALLQKNPSARVRTFPIQHFFQWGTPEDVKDYEYWHQTYSAFHEQRSHRKSYREVSKVLLPMAGLGSRFKNFFDQPKPLIALGKRLMFQEALDSLPPSKATRIVTLNSIAEKLPVSGFQIKALDTVPQGQALSVLAGLDEPTSSDLLITACDHGIALKADSWNQFYADPKCDAAIFTIRGFPGVERKPQSYSYVSTLMNDGDYPRVSQVGVKRPLRSPKEDSLLVGTFWFRDSLELKLMINELVQRNIQVNGEFYLDSIFSLFLEKNKVVREIPLSGYLCWGDPESLAESSYWSQVFHPNDFVGSEKDLSASLKGFIRAS